VKSNFECEKYLVFFPIGSGIPLKNVDRSEAKASLQSAQVIREGMLFWRGNIFRF